MNRYWAALVAAGAMATTVALGAQNPQNPANTPPPDASAPAEVQRTPEQPAPQARNQNMITVTGCIENAPAMSSAGAGGPVAGSTTAGREADQRSGNATSAGREATTNDTITAGRTPDPNTPSTTAGARAQQSASATTSPQFVLSSAEVSSAGTGANRGVVGTSGTAAATYQLAGETATLSPHLNRRVEITGTLQSSAASSTGAARSAAGSTAASPTLKVESVRVLAQTCASAGDTTPAGNERNETGNSNAPQPPQR